MPPNLKSPEKLSMREIEVEQIRNGRLISVNIVMAIKYDSNVQLTDEMKKYYQSIPEIAKRLREALVDNIKIEEMVKIMPWEISIKELLFILKPLIKNRSDFAKYMIVDGWN